MKLVNIGFGNLINAERLIAVLGTESAPTKRLVAAARQKNVLIDATYGRRARAVLVTDCEHIVLSALSTQAVLGRVQEEQNVQWEEESE